MSDAPAPQPSEKPPTDKPKARLVWLALAPLALLVALVAVSVSRLTSSNPAPTTFASPVRPAPAIQAQLLDGGSVDFANLGGPMIVNFWAPWCTPCRAEHPYLLEMQAQGVPILGVLHMDTSDKAKPDAAIERGKVHLEREKNPFTGVPVDPTGDISLAFGISGVPETFLIDASGQIAKTMRGPIVDEPTMKSFIDAYRVEKAKAAPAAGG